MPLPKPILLMTRPAAASQRFVDRLDPALLVQVHVCHAPLLRIVETGSEIQRGDARGLIFTSANGVRVASPLVDLKGIPAFCVGRATTQAATRAGWNAQEAGRDADALVENLIRNRPVSPLLHLRGRHARGDIAKRLTGAGLLTQEAVIYDQKAIPLSDEALHSLSGEGAVIAPVFSPRTAQILADATDRPLIVAALSAAVAEPLGTTPDRTIHVASQPDAQSMVGLVEKLLRATLPG